MPKRKRSDTEDSGRRRQFLGRVVNRSKVKKVELLSIGKLQLKPGWFNAGYIFPKGYSANLSYKDIANTDQKVSYNCQIVDNGGKPLFKVTSSSLKETFSGKSPTACWKQILDRINETLKAKKLPVVKTQVAGPEYFGLNDPFIVEAIEKLDGNKKCEVYWTEKEKILIAREEYAREGKNSEKKPRKKKKIEDEELDLSNEMTFREAYGGTWSAITRDERHKKRLANMGREPVIENDDNPIPDYEDPITLQPIVVPALSPYGHVAGYYSWSQSLRETNGLCPFTKLPLTIERIIKLNKRNFHLYKDYVDLNN